METTQYPHQLLELEVNETALSLQSQQTALNIQSFEAQGLTVTIDDFGLTQSSLDLLGAFSIGKVKLDRKLVRRIGSDEQVLALVQATLTQAVVQDIQMMVDGVDSLNQHDVLQRIGCILGQGAYFCLPLTAHAFEAFLVNRPLDTHARNIAPTSAQRQSYRAVRGSAA
jgi:diguanylate cyclase